MDCGNLKARLHAYLDGELTPVEREAFDLHLATCQACRREVEEYKALGDILKACPAPEVPEGLAERILAKAGQQGGRKVIPLPAKPFAPWLVLEGRAMRAAAAAAIVVGLSAGSLLGWTSLARSPGAEGRIGGAGAEMMLSLDAFSASPMEPLETMYLSMNTARP